MSCLNIQFRIEKTFPFWYYGLILFLKYFLVQFEDVAQSVNVCVKCELFI